MIFKIKKIILLKKEFTWCNWIKLIAILSKTAKEIKNEEMKNIK